jgi:hypothetical protein
MPFWDGGGYVNSSINRAAATYVIKLYTGDVWKEQKKEKKQQEG